MAKMAACKRGVKKKQKGVRVKEKRERERDITLVSEEHTTIG